MDYKDYIDFFVHEINYQLKMLGLHWNARLETEPVEGQQEEVAVITNSRGKRYPPLSIKMGYQAYLEGKALKDGLIPLFRKFFTDEITRDAFQDMEILKPEMVVPTFLNREKHEEELKQIPYYEFGDLAIVLQIVFQSIAGVNLNLKVTDELINDWNVEFDKLYRQAIDNPRNKKSVLLKNLFEISGVAAEQMEGLPPVYAITNAGVYWGAAAILYRDKMQELAELLGDKMVLLPLSVHEFIAIPQFRMDEEGIKYFTKVLADSNEIEQEFGENSFLSNHLYTYDRAKDEIRMIPDQSITRNQNKDHSR